MHNKKIESFLDAVYATAKDKSDKMIREIDDASASALKDYKAELRRSTDASRRREYARADAAGAELAAHGEAEIRASLYRRRDEIADEVFTAVRDRVLEYRKSAEYRDQLVADAKKVISVITDGGEGDGARILVAGEDIPVISDVCSAAAISVEASDEIALGGLIAATKTLEYDLTLDSRFASVKEDFTRESGLSVV